MYFRHNPSLNGHVSDRDIKSVDREIMYNYFKLHAPNQQDQPQSFSRNTPKRQSLQHQSIRDIKSCERDMTGGMSSSSSSSHNTPVNGKHAQLIKIMHQSPVSKIAPLENFVMKTDANRSNRSRSGSITPQHQQTFEADATEDDDLTCTSSSIYQYEMSTNSHSNNANHSGPQNSGNDDLLVECVSNSNDLLDMLDENDIENYETSKIKMKLMQKQLHDLTTLVNQALINKDLNQLAAQYGAKNFSANTKASNVTQHVSAPTTNLKVLNEKTRSLKNDLNSLKKMQENLNSSFGSSMKNFVQQLNVKFWCFYRL